MEMVINLGLFLQNHSLQLMLSRADVQRNIFLLNYNQYYIVNMQKYEIMSAIGEGAYGVVLKCRDVQNNTHVAIKKFKDSDEQQLTKKTTMRQVKILKMLSHENIVQMKQAFRKKGIVYLVFQYVENNLLQVLEKSPNGLHPSIIRRLIYQLVQGLVYLHNLDIVHRDIKPQNLLVSSRNELKICDFGFARQTKKQKGEIDLTDYVATRWYRPPQLLVGGEYGKQIDMWAVGCIMCELIDGNPLFPGQNQLDQLFLIQKSLGPLPQPLHQRFIKNQRFLGMKFPQIQNLDLIQKKYFGKIDQKGLSFIKSLLKMMPNQRLTANQALNHPYFEAQRNNLQNVPQSAASRKQIYSSTANRKKEDDSDYTGNLDRLTKYGKIYNKRKTNYNAIAMIYQSSNQCKIYNNQSKSVNKPYQKKLTTYNQNISLQKHHNKEILLKTQAKGFYIQGGEDKMTAFGQGTRKTTHDATWQSTTQLPFLLANQNNQPIQPSTGIVLKKKPQIVIQKTNTSSTSSNNKNNLGSNLHRK